MFVFLAQNKYSWFYGFPTQISFPSFFCLFHLVLFWLSAHMLRRAHSNADKIELTHDTWRLSTTHSQALRL